MRGDNSWATKARGHQESQSGIITILSAPSCLCVFVAKKREATKARGHQESQSGIIIILSAPSCLCVFVAKKREATKARRHQESQSGINISLVLLRAFASSWQKNE